MKDLTHGNILKVVLLFAIPIMLTNIFNSLYNMGDSMIVSNYVSADALAAVGATAVVTNLLMGFMNGCSQGFAIPVARSFGAKDMDGLRHYMAGSIILYIIVMGALTLVSFITIEPLLRLLNTPDSLMADSLAYIRIILAGLWLNGIYNFCASMLRAVGNSMVPLFFLIASVVMNIGMDILFIVVFHSGIKGAAYATVIAQGICAVVILIYLGIKEKELIPSKKDFEKVSNTYKELIPTGLAMALMSCIVNIGSVILQSGINSLDKTIIAAHTAARRVFEILCTCMFTVGIAMTTFCSQNLGAGKLDRIRKGIRRTIVFSVCEAGVLMVICYVLGRAVIHWITGSDDPELLDAATMYVRISAVNFVWLGPLFILRSSMQGLGHKIIPVFTSGVEFLVKVVSVIVLVPAFGYVGIAWTEPISWFLCLLLIGGFYLVNRKKIFAPLVDATK